MSIFKKILIPAVIVVALVAAYLVINGIQNKKDGDIVDVTESTTERIRIIEFKSYEANGLVVVNDEGEYIFEKPEEGNWEIKSHPELKIDPSRINSVAINMSSIMPEKLIEENASDISVYGLDNPIIITATTKDSASYTLQIGSKTPTGGAYYIKVKENNDVYTLGRYTTDRLLISRNGIKDKTLLVLEEGDPFTLAAELSIKKMGEDFLKAAKDGNDWYLSYPINNLANTSSIAPMIQSVAGISVKEFIEEMPKELEKYGLDVPSYEIRTIIGDVEIDLAIGDEAEPGKSRYVMLKGRDEVFTIDTTTFTALDKPLKEFMDPFAYIVNINTVSKIVVEIDGETHVMDIKTNEEDKDLDEFKFNGKDATMVDAKDNQPFRKLYQAVIGVTRASIETDVSPVGDADIRFTYTLKEEPFNMLVEFIPKDDFYYYLFRNGEYTGIMVENLKFDEKEGLREMLGIMKELTEAE